MSDEFYNRCEALLVGAQPTHTKDRPVLMPSSPELVSELVKCAAGTKQGIRIVGGGTMPVPATEQPPVPVSLAAIDNILEVNADDRLIIAQAGANADQVRARAEAAGLTLPFGITSGAEATIGGMYMTDAYVGASDGTGTMRSWVIGIQAIASTGELVTFGGRTVKNVTGFDVTRMLAGTRGMYAAVVQLVLRALPLPELRRTLAISVPGRLLAEVLGRIGPEVSRQRERCEIIAPEGLGGRITIQITVEGFNRLVKDRLRVLEDTLADIRDVETRTANPDVFVREHRALAKTMTGQPLHTITVPSGALSLLLGWIADCEPHSPLIAHVLHGRVHVVFRNEASVGFLRDRSQAIGGTMPVAWGHTLVRGQVSGFTEPERSLARALKQQLDPDGIFNPHLWI